MEGTVGRFCEAAEDRLPPEIFGRFIETAYMLEDEFKCRQQCLLAVNRHSRGSEPASTR